MASATGFNLGQALLTGQQVAQGREARDQRAMLQQALGGATQALESRQGVEAAQSELIRAGSPSAANAIGQLLAKSNEKDRQQLVFGLHTASQFEGEDQIKYLQSLKKFTKGNPAMAEKLDLVASMDQVKRDTAVFSAMEMLSGTGAFGKQTDDRTKEEKLADATNLTGEERKNFLLGREKKPGDALDRNLRARQIAVSEAAEERQKSKLSAGLEKALLESQDRVVSAQRNANEYTVLAGDFERLSLEGGLKSSFSESLKGILGTQDDVSEFRRRFNKVRLSEGLKNLPPGPATDRDVQEAFKGVPKDNASSEQVASFLRGAARLARFEAGYNQFKADFITENRGAGGINKAWRSKLESPALKRSVSVAEIYETAQNRGITPEEVRQQLGIQ